jgi:Carboxyl transferase domain
MHYSQVLLRQSGLWARVSKRPTPIVYRTRSYHAASVLPSLVSPSSPDFQARAKAMDQVVADLDAKLAAAREGGGAKAAERMRNKGKKLPRERYHFLPPLLWNFSDYLTLAFIHTCCSDSAVLHRLALLLDPHSPFLELSPLAAHEVYPGESLPGAGIITGIGRISGRECVVVVNDATVKGGSYYPLTVSRFDPTLYAPLPPKQNIFLRVGEEALACPGDCEGSWFTLCLHRCVLRRVMIPVLLSVACHVVESGGAALPHQANVREPFSLPSPGAD